MGGQVELVRWLGFHPHPRIKYGAGSSPLPSRERGCWRKGPSTGSGTNGRWRLWVPAFAGTTVGGEKWWAIVDSNHGPQSYQDCALTV